MASRILSRYRTPLTALGGALFAFVLMFAYLTLNPPAGRYGDADIKRLADERIQAVTPSPPVEPEVYSLVRPSVVLITSDLSTEHEKSRSVGSGVVFDASGSILTAYHVVADNDLVGIRFYDGTVVSGRVVQKQPERDLAVVQVRRMPDGVQPATLSGGVREGDHVLAFGSPYGLDGSISAGIVSGLNRRFTVEETGTILENMIQFDAAVNPGNSGGPLVDLNGRVIGIVSGIINPTNERVFIGIGFAVPIDSASGILPHID